MPVITDSRSAPSDEDGKHRGGLFAGKRHLEEELARLQQIVDSMGITERDRLLGELDRLRSEVPTLRAERESLVVAIGPLRVETSDLDKARSELTEIRQEVGVLQSRKVELANQLAESQQFQNERAALAAELDQLRRQVVETQETIILQEVGIYRYRHPLEDAVAYKARLVGLQAQIKDAVRAGGAVPRYHELDGQRLNQPGNEDGQGVLKAYAPGL